METNLAEEGALILRASNCLRCYTNKDTINDSACSKSFKIQEHYHQLVRNPPTGVETDPVIDSMRYGERKTLFAMKRRQKENYCRASLS